MCLSFDGHPTRWARHPFHEPFVKAGTAEEMPAGQFFDDVMLFVTLQTDYAGSFFDNFQILEEARF